MKGDAGVIERLNQALKLELGAVSQYWLHYRLTEDWGFARLAKKEREESIEEMHHADRLIARIIFLAGFPNLQTVAPLRIGKTSARFWMPIWPANMRPRPLTASPATYARRCATT